MLKKYQPERQDLLINTDWGIPSEQLSSNAAKGSGLKLFHGRWVTKAEKKQLCDEAHTYHSIRIIGYLLVFSAIVIGYLLVVQTLFILNNFGTNSPKNIIGASVMALYGFFMLMAGPGLIKFRRRARNIAVLVFASFIFLPFIPLLEDEKGAPSLIVFGLVGLNYLLKKTTRKILAPSSTENGDEK
jgi:hypothetical protein